MDWKTTAAGLLIASLPVTGTVYAQNVNSANDQAASALQNAALKSQYDTLQQLEEQETALNQQLTEKRLNQKLNDKIRTVIAEIEQELGLDIDKAAQQKLKSKQAEIDSAMQEIHRMKAERQKQLLLAAELRKQYNIAGLAGVLDQVIQLQRQINAVEQQLLKK